MSDNEPADILPEDETLRVNEIDGFWCRSRQQAGLIAMQKVVGSNPISRFFADPLHVGGLVSAWSPNQMEPSPHIADARD
jgi:hypothetical protein